MEDEKKQLIREVYLDIVRTESRLPTHADFIRRSITRNNIRDHFGNLTLLHAHIEEDFPDLLGEGVAHESLVFSKKKLKQLSTNLRKYKRFVISSAVNGKKVHEGFLKTLRAYCEANDAFLILLPCADIASTSTVVKKWAFDPLLGSEFFIHEETRLNDNFFLSNIKISAKQINPTTGLSRVGQRNGSYIFASPKQSLEHVATSGTKKTRVMALMTPGAITVADYSSERYMSDRTSYIAETDHVIGAVVVEVPNRKKFHFRQLQANEAGEFIDLGVRYRPDGTTEQESAELVLGDYHSRWVDPLVKKATRGICQRVSVSNIILHDFFDGYSINHHDSKKPLKQAIRVMENRASLKEEILECARELNWLHGLTTGDLIHVRGNHDDRLENWLMTAEYARDSINHHFALDLAKALLEGQDPLRKALTENLVLLEPDRIQFLRRDEEYKVAGVELGQHGDLGPAGTRASLPSLEKAYGTCVVAHTHSAAILRGVYRVGTSTLLRMDYNKGPSNWTHSHALVYSDGSRQLVNIIDGEWCL